MSYHIIHKTVQGKSLAFKVKSHQKSLNSKETAAVNKMLDNQKVVSGKSCVVIFFRKPKMVAVQRCDNRHTFKSASFRNAARVRAKKLLRHNKKGRFTRK